MESRGSVPTMRMAALGAESTPPEYCNGATPQSRRQFVQLRQQLHHFRHRIPEDDPRRPTSVGLIDEIASVGCVAHPPADQPSHRVAS